MDQDNECVAGELPDRACGTYRLQDWLEKGSDKERAAFDAALASIGFKPAARIQQLEKLRCRAKRPADEQ